MANAQSFPLLRLPLLGYEKVLQLMNFEAQFDISSLNKRLIIAIRHILRKYSFKLSIWFSNNVVDLAILSEEIEGFGDKPDFLWSSVYVVHRNLRVNHIKDQIVHLANICHILAVHVRFNEPHRRVNVEFIPFIKSLNLKLGHVEAYSYDTENALCRFLLTECSHAQEMLLDIETSYDFMLSPETLGSISVEKFQISNARWFSVAHLTASFMNCRSIHLTEIDFSHQEINVFLRAWVENSTIQRFEMTLVIRYRPRFNLEEAIDDLPTEVAMVEIPDENGVLVVPGHVLHSANGSQAAVYLVRRHFGLNTNYQILNNEEDEFDSDEDFDAENQVDAEEEDDSDEDFDAENQVDAEEENDSDEDFDAEKEDENI